MVRKAQSKGINLLWDLENIENKFIWESLKVAYPTKYKVIMKYFFSQFEQIHTWGCKRGSQMSTIDIKLITLFMHI